MGGQGGWVLEAALLKNGTSRLSPDCLGFRVQGLGFRVQGLVQGLGFRV